MTKKRPDPPKAFLKELAPPTPSYPYFDKASQRVFAASAKNYSRKNASWLADASLLAYESEGRIRNTFKKELDATTSFHAKRGTHAYVAEMPAFAVVAFRGTQVDTFWETLADIVTDLGVIPTLAKGAPGVVHSGFQAGLDDVWEPLRKRLEALPEGKPVWFTGHSLGAALATLAAARFGRAQGLYTFGSPRVGNLAFVNGVTCPVFRVVNNMDVVTTLPIELPFAYTHAGGLRFIDASGSVHEEQGALHQLLANAAVGTLALQQLRMLIKAKSRELDFPLPGFLADHAPIYYAMYLWDAAG